MRDKDMLDEVVDAAVDALEEEVDFAGSQTNAFATRRKERGGAMRDRDLVDEVVDTAVELEGADFAGPGNGGGRRNRISPVFRYREWDFLVVPTSVGPQGFYRSTGDRSGMRGRWLPFDEIYEWNLDRARGWVNKDEYTIRFGRGHPLHRFGSNEFRAISDALTQRNIPRGIGILRDEAHVNSILDFFDARITPSNRFRPTPAFRRS